MEKYFHFPPDILALLIDTIPRICKTKRDVIIFFEGAGVPAKELVRYKSLLTSNKDLFKKYNVTRELLEMLNLAGDNMLGVRRKILQNVIEFDAFDTCYFNDKDRAKANILDLKKAISMKDSATKYENYLKNERRKRMQEQQQKADKLAGTKNRLAKIKEDFNFLFSMQNPQERGKKLEKVLNDLFAFFKIGVKEDFVIYDEDSGKNSEQIDGVIEINYYLTLVEMKWEKHAIGSDKVGRFMSRLLVRRNVDGIIISYSSFTETAIRTAKEALAVAVLALVDLKDIYVILDKEKDLQVYFTKLIQQVKLYKNPKPHIDISELPNIDYKTYS